MRVLDCFSGIGGFSLGLERAGMTTVGFCEIEPFPRAVLKKHWSNIWCHDDVRTLTGDLVQQRCGTVDLVCGGVPCQPASVAGKRRGSADDRWLWGEFMRIVRTVRPRWVVAENVPGFLSLGDESEAVFCELEQEGYEVWPLIVGADDVGAPHRRKRLWIVANCERGESGTGHKFDMQWRRAREAEQIRMGSGDKLSNLHRGGFGIDGSAPRRGGHVDECGAIMANGNGTRLEVNQGERCDDGTQRTAAIGSRWPARPGERQHEWEQPRLIKFGVGGSIAGLSVRLVRASNRNALRAYGNSIVPQCSEAIGRAIMQVETANNTGTEPKQPRATRRKGK